MALSLHTDSPLSDLRCCLYLQLSLRFFSAADTSRLLSLHYTTLSRFVHTTRFSPLCSLRLCVFNTALLSSLRSLLPVQSCSPRCLIPNTVVCSFRTSRTIRPSFSFHLLLPCPSFSLRSLLSFSSSPLPLFRALLSSQPAVFCRLASHAFIHFFPSSDSPSFLRLPRLSPRLVPPQFARVSLGQLVNTPPTISPV